MCWFNLFIQAASSHHQQLISSHLPYPVKDPGEQRVAGVDLLPREPLPQFLLAGLQPRTEPAQSPENLSLNKVDR